MYIGGYKFMQVYKQYLITKIYQEKCGHLKVTKKATGIIGLRNAHIIELTIKEIELDMEDESKLRLEASKIPTYLQCSPQSLHILVI